MALPITTRIKPSKPSLSRVPLHGLDHVPMLYTPLNLFFKPSPNQAGPTELHDFAKSLQDVLDRLPFIAGSISTVRDTHGVESKHFVDDGRGVDLIWMEHSLAYAADLPQLSEITPREIPYDPYTPDQTFLMVKFTKFACGTLVMGISFLHMIVDCTSFVNVVKEWARVSRGGPISDALNITSWERNPGKFFPPPTPGIIPYGMYMPTGPPPPPPLSPPTTMSSFFFTWESLRALKDSCRPAEASAWVSTGDCVGAVVWRALTTARKSLLKPGRDVHLYIAVDARRHSKSQPQATKYFGNLVTPITASLSQSALLNGSLGSVSLALRRTIQEQVNETNCANLLALFDSLKAIPRICDSDVGDSRISNWTMYPLVGEALDFGGGAPFRDTTERFSAGQILILPQQDGYLGSLMVETEWVKALQTNDELLTYATVC